MLSLLFYTLTPFISPFFPVVKNKQVYFFLIHGIFSHFRHPSIDSEIPYNPRAYIRHDTSTRSLVLGPHLSTQYLLRQSCSHRYQVILSTDSFHCYLQSLYSQPHRTTLVCSCFSTGAHGDCESGIGPLD